MNYKIVKLDGRHSHRKIYRYCIEFSRYPYGTGVIDFDRARRWFSRTYGWSQDVRTQAEMARSLNDRALQIPLQSDDFNLAWAYCTEYKNYRIYVASDKELMMFELTHAGTA